MALSDIITSLRLLANDGPDSKVIFSEKLGSDPSMKVDGTNKTFRLKNVPLVGAVGQATNVWITIVGTGAVLRGQLNTLFTVTDPTNGIITFVSAPNPGSSSADNGVYADYNYNWFSDARYTEFLNQAAQMTVAGTTDPTTVAEGLKEAMLQYALSHFWAARASQYADRYASSGGTAGQSVESVAKAFTSLASLASKRADALKKDFYQRQGQREAMAVSISGFGIDPISPRR